MEFSILLSLFLNKANTNRVHKVICCLFVALRAITNSTLTTLHVSNLHSVQTGSGHTYALSRRQNGVMKYRIVSNQCLLVRKTVTLTKIQAIKVLFKM